jgi:hypothetical protein
MLPTPVHVRPAYASYGRSLYVTTFREVINSDGQSHCFREKGLPRQSTARRLINMRIHTQFLSQGSHWSSGGKATLCWRQVTRLTGLISPVCNRYVQYLLTGTNPSVLNRHRRGLSHRNLGIATTLSPPFPSECFTGPPKWPCPVSILSTLISNNKSERV